jgi:thiol-disulfide isomerase/thioredoxin
MKPLFFAFVFFQVMNYSFSQTNEKATLEVEIRNSIGKDLFLSLEDKVIQKIKRIRKGVYRDTINVQQGNYKLFDGKNYYDISLNNKCNLKMVVDANNVEETILFSGVCAEVNNFNTQSRIADKKIDYCGLLSLNEIEFKKKWNEIKEEHSKRIHKYVTNPVFIADYEAELIRNDQKIIAEYQKKKAYDLSVKKYEQNTNEANLLNGSHAASFNFLNVEGGQNKLEDFRGKYVFINVWTSWSTKAKGEMPYLKNIIEKYKAKNIVFVNISLDQPKDIEKWKAAIAENTLGGVNLFSDKSWKSDFVKALKITGVPRYILIDPQGNILKSVAPRPSSSELSTLLDAEL